MGPEKKHKFPGDPVFSSTFSFNSARFLKKCEKWRDPDVFETKLPWDLYSFYSTPIIGKARGNLTPYICKMAAIEIPLRTTEEVLVVNPNDLKDDEAFLLELLAEERIPAKIYIKLSVGYIAYIFFVLGRSID